VKLKFHARFCSGGGTGDCLADHVVRFVRPKSRLFSGGMGGRAGFFFSLTTDSLTLGEIPNSLSTRNSVIPTVASGLQSVKRDEKRVSPESNWVTPVSKCLWADNEQATEPSLTPTSQRGLIGLTKVVTDRGKASFAVTLVDPH
jgi:hypothetical protein